MYPHIKNNRSDVIVSGKLEYLMSGDVKRIQLDHLSGMVRCFNGTSETFAVHKEQLNIEDGGDLEEFVKASGGVKQATALILNM